jgi:hypothetical protein
MNKPYAAKDLLLASELQTNFMGEAFILWMPQVRMKENFEAIPID